MTPTGGDLDEVLVSDLELWRDGPPHTLFGRLRSECPVHWTGGIPGYPGESGYWSVTRPRTSTPSADDGRTYSSERAGITSVGVFPLELIRSMFAAGCARCSSNPSSAGCCSRTLADPSGRGSLPMFPAFAHFGRTATRDTELAGRPIREGDKVVM